MRGAFRFARFLFCLSRQSDFKKKFPDRNKKAAELSMPQTSVVRNGCLTRPTQPTTATVKADGGDRIGLELQQCKPHVGSLTGFRLPPCGFCFGGTYCLPLRALPLFAACVIHFPPRKRRTEQRQSMSPPSIIHFIILNRGGAHGDRSRNSFPL